MKTANKTDKAADKAPKAAAKPKVAFFDFASCEGCQLQITNIGELLLDVLGAVDVVEFREAISEKYDGDYDVVFVEGSIGDHHAEERLKKLRARAKVLIAYGACACTGGINALKNHTTDYKDFVYQKDARMPHLDSAKALPISAAIKVDYAALGCPVNKYEVLQIISHLLHGKEPVVPTWPVCVECKRRETVCRYAEGDHCLGPIARAGCTAPCPADGIPCEACRGLVEHANEAAMEKVLMQRAGFSKQRASSKSRMFAANCRADTVQEGAK